ncbi:MAG: ABC transporter permease subunit, partial [Candidatus Puniceispirillaceae bacterium]
MSNTSLTSLIYDARIRGYVFQVLILGLIGLGVWSLVDNTVTNLAERGKSVGFGFLTATSGFQISDTLGTWVMDYSVGESTYLDVYFIGIINTFLVAILGIIGATFLGFSIGIMRLSRNFIIRSFATVYIEILRNLPLLLQLFFWYFAVLRALPSKREKIDLIPDFMAMNITGLYLPAPVAQPGFIYSVIALGVAIIITFVMKRWAEKRQS